MEWTQVLTIVLANVGLSITLFLWLRKESNADRREVLSLIEAIKNEMKDFHGRLCTIEERHRVP